MHIMFRPKPLRILASLAIVALFFLLLPKCYTTTASADSGEYTATYTAQQAAAAPSPDGDCMYTCTTCRARQCSAAIWLCWN